MHAMQQLVIQTKRRWLDRVLLCAVLIVSFALCKNGKLNKSALYIHFKESETLKKNIKQNHNLYKSTRMGFKPTRVLHLANFAVEKHFGFILNLDFWMDTQLCLFTWFTNAVFPLRVSETVFFLCPLRRGSAHSATHISVFLLHSKPYSKGLLVQ